MDEIKNLVLILLYSAPNYGESDSEKPISYSSNEAMDTTEDDLEKKSKTDSTDPDGRNTAKKLHSIKTVEVT